MSQKTQVLASLLIASFGFGFAGCNRSPSFKKDQEYYRGDSSQSYYSKGAKSPTARVDAMGQPKKRVVIFDFWNDTPVKSKTLGQFAADEIRRSLFATQRMILPTELKLEHATEDFLQGDRVKVAQLIREGRQMGVSVLVIGRLTRIVFRQRGDEVGLLRQKQSLAAVDVELKLFDVAAGREIMAAAKSGEASQNSLIALEGNNAENLEFRNELTSLALRNATSQLVPDVIRAIEKMQWEGRIAKIAGPKIYINAGKASGLVAGDILKVLAPGDDVYDPATGAYLGRTQGQLKGTLEVVDFLGTDGAVTEIHTGANFQDADVVQLY